MTSKKNTKYTLFSSLMAMLICVSMLIGTTFAWFTDNAVTGVNKIQAGTLDVTLEMKDTNGNWVSAEGETLSFVDLDTNDLWEPGCTYHLPSLRVVNKGSLSLKYKLVITGINGDAKLNEVIDWTIDGLAVDTMYSLGAGTNSPDLNISGHMKETAGDQYQGLSIDGITLTVYATQDTAESDSFGNTYDNDAEKMIPDTFVSSPSDFQAALTNAAPGDTIKLTAAGTYTVPANTNNVVITGTEDTAISIAGKPSGLNNITFVGVTVENSNTTYDGYTHSNNLVFENCTINGQYFAYSTNTFFYNCTFNQTNASLYNIWTYGASNISFEKCTFNSAGRSVLVYIEGGAGQNASFKDCTFTASTPAGSNKAAIEIDSSLISGVFNVNINNCSATGFDPAGEVPGLVHNKLGSKTNIVVNGVTLLSAS